MTTAENPMFDPAADDQRLLNEVIAFYQQCLRGSEPAQAYLAKRQIDDPEAVDRFQIGYADRRLGLALPPTPRKGEPRGKRCPCSNV